MKSSNSSISTEANRMRYNKIFGVGLSRTGTTSLTKALRILGYHAVHFPRGLLSGRFSLVDKYDALTDTPVSRHYKELDALYPHAAFILTVREMSSWLNSCRRFFYPGRFQDNPQILRLCDELYGTVEFNDAKFRTAYEAHVSEVKEYFARRSQDVLFFDICGGGDWETLCTFLRKPIPEVPFPHLNQGKVQVETRKRDQPPRGVTSKSAPPTSVSRRSECCKTG